MEGYQKATATGESYAQQANDGAGCKIKTVSADTTLTASDSGKTIVLSNATGEDIILPAVAEGLKYKFIVGSAFITSAWTVTATTKVIQGTVLVNGASVLGANEDIITFAHAAENVGDWVEIESDGTNWYVSGVGSAASSIALTASA